MIIAAAVQQVEIILQQWDGTQQQVEIILQQWELTQQQVDIFLQQWDMTQKQVEILLQQWVVAQQQVEEFPQQWDNGTTASGDNSTAMGMNTTASDFGSLVIGQYNSSGSSATSASDRFFSTANTAFVIGNGADTDNKADAFKVMFNGDTTIGNDLTVSGDVVVSSDARLKANIVSLGATLAKLLLIDGKSYTMKKDGKQKIGVLAQDIQKVFPELVSTDDRDMLAVNYQGLVPVLINALKEQDGKMKEQEERLERLEAIISNMDK